MDMTNDQINVFQMYLQMYDKGIISKKTVLEKIGINAEEEQKEVEKDREKDMEFNKKRYETSLCGGTGSGPA